MAEDLSEREKLLEGSSAIFASRLHFIYRSMQGERATKSENGGFVRIQKTNCKTAATVKFSGHWHDRNRKMFLDLFLCIHDISIGFEGQYIVFLL